MNRPPSLRAHRWLKKAVRAFPKCREPVGEGAKRVTIGMDISEDCTHIIRVESRRMKQLILGLGLLAATLISTSNAAEPPASAAAQSPAAQPPAAQPPAAQPPAAQSTPAPAKPGASPSAPASPATNPQVQVVTSMGNFTIELNAERAPLTVAQF